MSSPVAPAGKPGATIQAMANVKPSEPERAAAPSPVNHTMVSGFSSPVFRGELNHGATAELQEGFRILTGGQKATFVSRKDLSSVIHTAGFHVTDEELQEMLRVVHQDARTDELEFSEFMLLMTKQVDAAMVEELKTAFQVMDPTHSGFVTKKQFTEIFISRGERSSTEELEELLALAEATEDSDKVDYHKVVSEIALQLNTM